MVRSINVEPEDKQNIKYLSNELGKTPIIAVFYMPGCIHCQMLKEPWGNFENRMINNNEDTILAWVHKDVEQKLPDKIKKNVTIQGYPTIIGFDKKGGAKEFQKERNVDSLLNFYREITKGEMKGGSNGNKRNDNKRNIHDMTTASEPPSTPQRKKYLKPKQSGIVSPLTPLRGLNDEAPTNKNEYYEITTLPSLIESVEKDIVKEFDKYSSDITDAAKSLVSMSGKKPTSPKTKTKKGGKRKKKRNSRKKRNTRKNKKK